MEVSLHDVALAVAVPCDEHDFSVLYDSGTSDFIRHLSRPFPRGERALVWKHYEHGFASFAQEVIARLDRLGILVRRRVTGRDLAQVLRDHALVAVVAHHPCPPFAPSDILDPGGLARVLEEADTEPLLSLRSYAMGAPF